MQKIYCTDKKLTSEIWIKANPKFCLEISFFHSVLQVQMHNGDVYEANIKDIDKKSDIATIKINSQVSPLLYWISSTNIHATTCKK